MVPGSIDRHTALTFRKGFTLLEVVIAMSILAIGILATLAMAHVSTRNTTSGDVVTQATLLAMARIEEIKSTQDLSVLQNKFQDEPQATLSKIEVEQPAKLTMPDAQSATFSISYQFKDPLAGLLPNNVFPNCETATPGGGSGICFVTVAIAWKRGGGGRGGAGQIELDTITYGDGI